MIIKPVVLGDVVGAMRYLREMVSANGNPRPQAPILTGDSEEMLLQVVRSRPSTRPFAVILSYYESLEKVGVEVIITECRRYLEVCAGGMPLDRIVWRAAIHARHHGCDAHLIACPIDLHTGLVLPLFARDRAMVQLNELLPRWWDLQRGRASPGDWWRHGPRRGCVVRRDRRGHSRWYPSRNVWISRGSRRRLARCRSPGGGGFFYPHRYLL